MPEHTPAPTPSRAVYGFAMYLSFNILFVLYLIWALVPETYFEQIGIDFLPQRHWAVSVPIYVLTILLVFAFIIYPSLGQIMTPNLDDMRTITDNFCEQRKNTKREVTDAINNVECVCEDPKQCWKDYYELGYAVAVEKRIPVLKDLNIWDVSAELYG